MTEDGFQQAAPAASALPSLTVPTVSEYDPYLPGMKPEVAAAITEALNRGATDSEVARAARTVAINLERAENPTRNWNTHQGHRDLELVGSAAETQALWVAARERPGMENQRRYGDTKTGETLRAQFDMRKSEAFQALEAEMLTGTQDPTFKQRINDTVTQVLTEAGYSPKVVAAEAHKAAIALQTGADLRAKNPNSPLLDMNQWHPVWRPAAPSPGPGPTE